MDLQIFLLLISNALLALAWIWGLFVMSAYIRKGKGWAFALTPFWIFATSWFTDDGHPYLKKVRISVGLAFALFFVAFLNIANR